MNKRITKKEFSEKLTAALKEAADGVRKRYSIEVPQKFVFLLNGIGYSGVEFSRESISDIIYISETLFYKIIDICVISVRGGVSKIFMRVSDHAPVAYGNTWNPSSFGPFKILEAASVEY